MFYNGDDEEQDFLSPTGGSKLASLFGMDKASSQGGNESLTYTAPKEPKKKGDTASVAGQAASASSLLLADVVFAYKYVDDKFASQGKVGAAVVANHVANDYKILLYVTKDKPLAYAKISPTFSFVVQPSNYASFYDDVSQSWSVMFDSETKLIAFAKQVSLSKAMSARPKLNALVIQDLSLGEGPGIETGDSVEMKYTGWLLEENTFGTLFETNSTAEKLSRLRVGSGKNLKAWEEGLLGMKKNSKRLVISPPSFAYGAEGKAGKVPPSATVLFELEVVRVKFVRDRGSEGGVATSDQVAPDVDEKEVEGSKSRSKISPESSTQLPAKTDKAKLISRMAKMGQPMLPLVTSAPPTDVTESEVPVSPGSSGSRPGVPSKPAHHGHGHTTYGHVSPSPHPQFPPPQGMSREQGMYTQQQSNMFPQAQGMYGQGGASQISVYQPQHPMQYPQMMGGYPYGIPQPQVPPYGGAPMYPGPSQMYQAPPAPPPTVVPPPQAGGTDANLSMMMIETRQQNTEVRVSLSKVVDKMDRMGEKLDQLHGLQTSSMSVANSMPSMEVGMLVHNIERIVKENERLKNDTMEKSSRIETLNTKIGELLQRNQVYIEQSNAMLEQRNDAYKSTATQSQVKVQSLEQEKVQYATELSLTTSQLASCQLETATLKKKDGEMRQQLEKLMTSDTQNRDELTTLRIQLSENGQTVEQATTQLKQETQRRKQLSGQVTEIQETIAELTADKDSLEKKLAENKCKTAEELTKLETEMEAMKTSFEKEISTLKDRLKQEKNSTELTTSQQVTQLEEELNHDWKEKCDRLGSASQEKHQRELAEVVTEKKWLEEKVATLESKITELKSVRVSGERELESVHEELEQLRLGKDKYDALKAQATAMKDKYEVRFAELEKERDAAQQEVVEASEEQDRLSERLKRASVQLALASASGGVGSAAAPQADVTSEVKKIMSTVYHKVRGEISEGETYEGSVVHSAILGVIKTVTLEMIRSKEAPTSTNEDESDSEVSDEGDIEKREVIEKTQASVPPGGDDGVSVKRGGDGLSAVSDASVNVKRGNEEEQQSKIQAGEVGDSKSTADIIDIKETDTEAWNTMEEAELRNDILTTDGDEFRNDSSTESFKIQNNLQDESPKFETDLAKESLRHEDVLQNKGVHEGREAEVTSSGESKDTGGVSSSPSNRSEELGVTSPLEDKEPNVSKKSDDIESNKIEDGDLNQVKKVEADLASEDLDDWEDEEEGSPAEASPAHRSVQEDSKEDRSVLAHEAVVSVAVVGSEIEAPQVSQRVSDTSTDILEDFQETVESFEPDSVAVDTKNVDTGVNPGEVDEFGDGSGNVYPPTSENTKSNSSKVVEETASADVTDMTEHIPTVQPKAGESDEEGLFKDSLGPPLATSTAASKMASKSVFDDDDDDDLFGFTSAQSKPVVRKSPGQGGAKTASVKLKPSTAVDQSEAKTKGTESDEDTNKAPPPLPLFRDSDEEDNLDWLS